MADVISLGV